MHILPDLIDHNALARQRAADLEIAFQQGRYYRYIWPWHSLGITLLILYMLAPPSKSRLYFLARYPLYAFASYQSIAAFLFCRTASPPAAYGIGIINAFALAWLAFHLIWRDTRTESLVLAWSDGSYRDGDGSEDDAAGIPKDGTASTGVDTVNDRPQLRHRTDAFAANFMQQEAEEPYRNSGSKSSHSDTPVPQLEACRIESTEDELRPQTQRRYYWQPLPASLWPRISWIVTILLSLRGEGTTHGIASLPPFPAHMTHSLRETSPSIPPPSFTTDPRTPLTYFRTRSATTRFFTIVFLRTYLLTDLAKFLVSFDPFFIGLCHIDSPLTFPIPAAFQNAIFARTIRLALSAFSMHSILTLLTSLFPLFFLSALNARPEPSLYPSVFGASYLHIISTTGLAGTWSLWWHQMFRLSLSAPHKPVCSWLHISPESNAGKVLGLCIAFALSAAIHAAGSTTNIGPSEPWMKSGLFFALQPLGILFEMGVKAGARQMGVARLVPGWLKRLLLLVWVHVWFYHTAWLFATDVATGGVWLTEPVPVSLIAGVMGRGWWRWEWWMGPRWVWGERFWERGIAF